MKFPFEIPAFPVGVATLFTSTEMRLRLQLKNSKANEFTNLC